MTDEEKESLYLEALELKEADSYDSYQRAYKRFIELGDYKDSKEMAEECKVHIEEANSFVGNIYGKRKKAKIIILWTVAAIAVCLLSYGIYKTFVVRELDYRKAVAYYEAGDYDSARAIFERLGKYKKSQNYMKESSQKTEIAIGNTIYFGSIEQDNDGKDEFIEWIILDIQDNKALLLTRYAIYNYIFDDDQGQSPWATSDLRTWLNKDFINRAFTRDERLKICPTTVVADSNPYYEKLFTETNTWDEVFVLSASEMEKYLDTNEKRMCFATPYALYYGAVVNADTKTTFYWTRTQGSTLNNIVSVDSTGELFYPGSVKTSIRRAVRPAMWIDITDFVDKEHSNPGYEDIEIPEENKGDYIN